MISEVFSFIWHPGSDKLVEIHLVSGFHFHSLSAGGRYCFSAEEAVGALGTTVVATRAALRCEREWYLDQVSP
jgi:hypothetical protein